MRIMLALDGSQESIEAAKFLSHLPIIDRSEVIAVSVLVNTPFDDVEAESGVLLREAEQAAAKKHFQSVLKIFEDAKITFATVPEHVIIQGHPNRELLEIGRQRDVDLIALGARGHSLIARALLGSTSDYVANHARCPVLIVRPTHAETPGHIRILLGYDGSPGSKVAAEQLFGLPWGEATEVQITMLLERPTLLPDDTVYDPTAIEEAERSLSELVAESKCSANVSYKVCETVHVGSYLAHLSIHEKGDLIFVGDSGKSAIARFFLGSAARHVLHHSACSVWVARAKQWG